MLNEPETYLTDDSEIEFAETRGSEKANRRNVLEVRRKIEDLEEERALRKLLENSF